VRDAFREFAAAITTLRRRWKRTGTDVIVEALRRGRGHLPLAAQRSRRARVALAASSMAAMRGTRALGG
jgi:hypothetical protein